MTTGSDTRSPLDDGEGFEDGSRTCIAAYGGLGFVLSCQAASAAELVFPPASRVGIVPLDDMVLSKRFSGFENSEKATAITISEMPPRLMTNWSPA